MRIRNGVYVRKAKEELSLAWQEVGEEGEAMKREYSVNQSMLERVNASKVGHVCMN